MKKRVLSSILAGVLAVSVFAGCGSKTEDNSQAAADNSTDASNDVAATESGDASTSADGSLSYAAQ